MNPETALNLVAALMSSAKNSIGGRYGLVCRHGKLEVLPMELVGHLEDPLYKLRDADLTDGLSSRQWANLKKIITCHYSEKGVCQCHSKPSPS